MAAEWPGEREGRRSALGPGRAGIAAPGVTGSVWRSVWPGPLDRLGTDTAARRERIAPQGEKIERIAHRASRVASRDIDVGGPPSPRVASRSELRCLAYSIYDIASWVGQLIRENGRHDCLLRIIALGVIQAEDEALVAILPQSLPRYPDSYYWTGASVITYEGVRALPACKSLNTLVNYLARRQAIRAGVHEAILRQGGEMTEGSRSNIFAVRRDEVLTPPPDRALSGITRDIVIRLALEVGYRVSEAPLNLMDLSSYNEFFITSTSMHIIPIVRIGSALVGEGHVGPVTLNLMDRFEQYHRHYLESKR